MAHSSVVVTLGDSEPVDEEVLKERRAQVEDALRKLLAEKEHKEAELLKSIREAAEKKRLEEHAASIKRAAERFNESLNKQVAPSVERAFNPERDWAQAADKKLASCPLCVEGFRGVYGVHLQCVTCARKLLATNDQLNAQAMPIEKSSDRPARDYGDTF